jgi:hypothetical protein
MGFRSQDFINYTLLESHASSKQPLHHSEGDHLYWMFSVSTLQGIWIIVFAKTLGKFKSKLFDYY